jgi:hypothetical protein
MTKLKCNSTFGNYKWTATAEVSQEQLEVLASAGLLQVLQRSPASKAEKLMAGYEKRPDKFERKSIPFSKEGQTILENELGSEVELVAKTKDSPAITVQSVVETAFHDIGAGTEPKYLEEKGIIARHVKAGDFAQWMTDKVGFAATVADAENVEVLKAVKAYKQKLLAEG